MLITKLPFGWNLRPQHAQEDFEEETMEDDEAELTLNKVEEEMMVSTVITIRILILLNWLLYVSLFFTEKIISLWLAESWPIYR